jgi:hypothetical protein
MKIDKLLGISPVRHGKSPGRGAPMKQLHRFDCDWARVPMAARNAVFLLVVQESILAGNNGILIQ